jgi:4-alpha-glucanotransferase
LSKDQISLEFIRLALTSKSILAIIPMQDVLSLGAEARMNHPAGQFDNWSWRVKKEQLTIKSFENIAKIAEKAGRC